LWRDDVPFWFREVTQWAAPTVTIGTRIARSITGRTGALLGGAVFAAPILAATLTEKLWGRPSSTSGLAVLAAVALGTVGAVVGATLGAAFGKAVRNSPRAGPVDWRMAGVLLLLLAGIPTALVVRSEVRREALNMPRVILSTGEIVRSLGESSRPPISQAAFMWRSRSVSGTEVTAHALRWNGHPARVSVDDRTLEVTAGGIRADSVSLADYDYVREVYGVTATLTAGRAEFLALLLALRSTGHRALLLVFDPHGALVHQELLQRFAGTELWVAGPPGHQEISVNVGRPTRYSAAAR